MCEDCWADHGSPSEVTKRIRDVEAALKATTKRDEGNLYPIVGDWDVEDEDLVMVTECIRADPSSEAKRKVSELACVSALKRLNLKERITVLALYHGFLDPKVDTVDLKSELVKLADELVQAVNQLHRLPGTGLAQRTIRNVEESLRKLAES